MFLGCFLAPYGGALFQGISERVVNPFFLGGAAWLGSYWEPLSFRVFPEE